MIPRAISPRCCCSRGFTLLEIIVVVAVITIIASTILLNLNIKRPDSELRNHASRIGKTLQLLMQEAILEDHNYALSVLPQGYLVLEFNGEAWLPSEDRFIQSLQTEHAYSDELVIDNNIVAIEKSDEPKPHILMLSSGEMTVFQWEITDRENELSVRLQSSLQGDIIIEGPAEQF